MTKSKTLSLILFSTLLGFSGACSANPEIEIKTIFNEPETHIFEQLAVYEEHGQLHLEGKLFAGSGRKSLPIGHIDVTIINSRGKVLDEFYINYRGRFLKKSRPKGAPFYAPLAVSASFKGTVQLAYHKNKIMPFKWQH